MTRTAKIKPVKAWVVVNDDGEMTITGPMEALIWPTRQAAWTAIRAWKQSPLAFRIARVEIREIAAKGRKK